MKQQNGKTNSHYRYQDDNKFFSAIQHISTNSPESDNYTIEFYETFNKHIMYIPILYK